MRTRRTCILALFLLLSSVTLASTSFEPNVSALNGESITVHFVNVGQGDSIFIDSSGLDVLVDGRTRPAGDTVVEYLRNLGITKVDLMVATHMDADHIGGLIKVLSSAIQVNEVLTNNQTHNSGTYDDFMSFATNHTFNVAQRGDVYILTQTVNLTVLNPVQPLEFSTQNENSVVMRLQIGESSFLLMGDAEVNTEASILQSGLEVDSDVLKVGHHGSNTATSDAFLKCGFAFNRYNKRWAKQSVWASSSRNTGQAACTWNNGVRDLQIRKHSCNSKYDNNRIPNRPATSTRIHIDNSYSVSDGSAVCSCDYP
jgi:competence protein ComEC